MVTDLIIHCADWPNGKPLTIEEIDRWHHDRGFQRTENDRVLFNPMLAHIAYQWFIDVSGIAYSGRREGERGAHCKAKGMNSHSIGICLAGRNKYTIAQWTTLSNLVKVKMDEYNIDEVHGHCYYDPDNKPNCPGFDVDKWVKNNFTPDVDNVFTVRGVTA